MSNPSQSNESEKTLFLAANTEDEADEWIVYLNKVSAFIKIGVLGIKETRYFLNSLI